MKKIVRCAIEAPRGEERSARHAREALSSGLRHQIDLTDESDTELLILPVSSQGHAAATARIEALRRDRPACAVLVLCNDLSHEQTLTLIAAGPIDFVCAPYSDAELCARVARVTGLVPARTQALSPGGSDSELIGKTPAFMRQLEMLPVIAGCNMGVLILGETGTGKEVFAQAIHYLSPRKSRPLVAVNCGAIPNELMESELFGHTRGAFTSANAARSGLVREAEGGTLFLDEIDALPYGAQAKLLRFLQEKEYRAVGSSQLQHADVRVIAASNTNLRARVDSGIFRRDLYYRLNVLNLSLPPLRERREDIATLALHFLRRFSASQQRPVLGLSPQALQRLLAYEWPGNVRELKHAIERAVLMCRDPVIGERDLQLGDSPLAAAEPCEESFRRAKARVVESFERGYIEQALSSSGGNVTHAARAVRKNRRAFFELMRKHGIVPERYRDGLHAE